MKPLIPLVPAAPLQRPSPIPLASLLSAGPVESRTPAELLDTLGRPLRDLRISVTDRCNFRCAYCMPKEVFGPGHAFLPQREVLSFEEITQVASAFVALGVNKLRVTGGEPLLRRDLPRLLGMLAALRTPQGEPLDITLTTNGALLARQAAALKAAGLKRITVSLDALDDGVFRRMNDVDFPVTDVLQGIEAAAAAGLWPLKVNMVVRKGVNDSEILPMARHFRHTGVALRFIEFMDVGSHNGWCLDEVLPSQAIIQAIHAEFPLAPRAAASASDTAQLWAYADGAGEVGFISSVTQAFCRQCTRARLSTDGQLYRCLFARQGHSLKAWLRQGAGQSDLVQALTQWWQAREDRYSELRSLAPNPAAPPKVDMHFIGG